MKPPRQTHGGALLLLLLLLLSSSVRAKTITGVFRTYDAKREFGQYLTAFGFHGNTALIKYSLNTTGNTVPKLYLFLNEDWKEAVEATRCKGKLDKARITYELTSITGNLTVVHFTYPRIWHIVYVDAYTCDFHHLITPLEHPNFIYYEIQLFNPDLLDAPTVHFSDEETGLLFFYKLMTLTYFVLGCIFWPRLWQTLTKGGPMQLVIQLLTASTFLQAVGSFLMMVHLVRYAGDGLGSPFSELLAEFFDVVSQFAMLYMLLCLSLGWTLASSYKSSPLETIKKKPAAKVVGVLCAIQSTLFLWERYQDKEHRLYHAHRTYAGVSLVILRIFLAGLFAWNLHVTVSSERSALKREFYICFTKVLVENVWQTLPSTGMRMEWPLHGMLNKVTKREQLWQHIEAFTYHASHYACRGAPGRKYLPSDLNVRKMHQLFCQQNDAQITYAFYYSVFLYDFNLGFGHPAKDVCSACLKFRHRLRDPELPDEEKRTVMALYLLHCRRGRKFYELLNAVGDTYTVF